MNQNTATTVHIRDYVPTDFDAVVRLAREAFVDVTMPAESPAAGEAMARIIARDYLSKTTRARVAEVDGRVVGLTLARLQGQKTLPGGWRRRLANVADIIRMAVTAPRDLDALVMHARVLRAYPALRDRLAEPITDELELFAVDASCRGLGVGGKLFDDVLNHLSVTGRTRFHLFTDTDCTYAFYDARGMSRAAETTVTLTSRGQSRQLGVFLYEGDARSVRRSGEPALSAN